jgi:hypothetical protein
LTYSGVVADVLKINRRLVGHTSRQESDFQAVFKRRLGLLRKKGQRSLITERKIRVLRVDAARSVQALSWQKEKTISVLSALTSARGS